MPQCTCGVQPEKTLRSLLDAGESQGQAEKRNPLGLGAQLNRRFAGLASFCSGTAQGPSQTQCTSHLLLLIDRHTQAHRNMDIKLDVSKNVGLSLALAGIGGFAAGYALCHFISKSHAQAVRVEAGDSDGKASAMESMPTTPRGSVNGTSAAHGSHNLTMSLVVRSDLGLV